MVSTLNVVEYCVICIRLNDEQILTSVVLKCIYFFQKTKWKILMKLRLRLILKKQRNQCGENESVIDIDDTILIAVMIIVVS